MAQSVIVNSNTNSDAFTVDLRSMQRTNIADTAQILKTELNGKNFIRNNKEIHVGGYPLHNFPREVNGQRQVATDSRWSESVGMYKPAGNTKYPKIQAYNIEAMPRVLKGFGNYCVARNWRYRVLIDGALSTLITKFSIAKLAETDEVNHYYQAVPSGALATQGDRYYTYSTPTNNYVECRLLDPLSGGEHYYTEYWDETSKTYNYRTIEEEFPSTEGRHVAGTLHGRSIYRREAEGSGWKYICLGIVNDADTVLVGLTTNTSFSSDCRESKLYTQIEVDADACSDEIAVEAKTLFVDLGDEDIEEIKDVTNTLLQRYRTILAVTGRSVPNYSVIRGSGQYTAADLVERINAIVVSMCEHSEAKILPLPTDTYTVRDMELKINEIIDYIVNESYYFRLCDPSEEPNLRTAVSDLRDGFVSSMLYSMANASYIPENTHSYNDRWYYYEPSETYFKTVYTYRATYDTKVDASKTYYSKNPVTEVYTQVLSPTGNPSEQGWYERDQEAKNVYKLLNYSALSSENVVGNIQQQATTDPTFGGYMVCVDASGSGTWVSLCHVANVYNIADTWANCNYAGCMQIIDLTLDLLNSHTPGGDDDRKSWKTALTNPVKSITDPDIRSNLTGTLAEINAIQGMLEETLSKAPACADVVVDITHHVTALPKIVRDSVYPVRQVVTSYRADTAYYYRNASGAYVAISIVNQADFVAKRAEYGTIYAWVFLHDRF